LFLKNKVRLLERLSVFVLIPHIKSWMPEPVFMTTWYVYHNTWVHLNGVIHKSHPSVIPTLQPLKFLKQTSNIGLTPLPILMKLGTYIMPHEAISMA
jgi:hypothetical protein